MAPSWSRPVDGVLPFAATGFLQQPGRNRHVKVRRLTLYQVKNKIPGRKGFRGVFYKVEDGRKHKLFVHKWTIRISLLLFDNAVAVDAEAVRLRLDPSAPMQAGSKRAVEDSPCCADE